MSSYDMAMVIIIMRAMLLVMVMIIAMIMKMIVTLVMMMMIIIIVTVMMIMMIIMYDAAHLKSVPGRFQLSISQPPTGAKTIAPKFPTNLGK